MRQSQLSVHWAQGPFFTAGPVSTKPAGTKLKWYTSTPFKNSPSKKTFTCSGPAALHTPQNYTQHLLAMDKRAPVVVRPKLLTQRLPLCCWVTPWPWTSGPSSHPPFGCSHLTISLGTDSCSEGLLSCNPLKLAVCHLSPWWPLMPLNPWFSYPPPCFTFLTMLFTLWTAWLLCLLALGLSPSLEYKIHEFSQ